MSFAPVGGLLGVDRGTAGDRPAVVGRFDGEHLLVPILAESGAALADQTEVAAALARATGASLSVIEPVPRGGRPSGGPAPELAGGDEDALPDRAPGHAGEPAGPDGDFVRARSVVGGVLRAVRTRDVDTLVLPSGSHGGRLRAGLTEEIAAHADCDVVVVNGQPGYETAPSILLAVAAGPHSGLAADLARAIAEDWGAWVDVLHVVAEGASERDRERADELVEGVYRRIARPDTTTTWVLEAEDAAEAIVEQSAYYGLTILGAPTKGRLRRLAFGSTTGSVRANAGSVVLSARNNSDGRDARE